MKLLLSILIIVTSGCALLNTNSSSRRAGTYPPGTTIEFNPARGTVKANSTGDDELHIAKLQIGATSMEGFDLKFNRSTVVKAQGSRAKDMEALLHQDVEISEIQKELFLGLSQQINDLVSTVAPMITQMKQMKVQQTDNSNQIRTLLNEIQTLRGVGTPVGTFVPNNGVPNPN